MIHRARLSVTVKALSILPVAGVALLGIAGCGENNSSQGIGVIATNEVLVDSSEPSSPPEDIVGTTLEGASFSLRAALAEKPVVLWFWSPG